MSGQNGNITFFIPKMTTRISTWQDFNPALIQTYLGRDLRTLCEKETGKYHVSARRFTAALLELYKERQLIVRLPTIIEPMQIWEFAQLQQTRLMHVVYIETDGPCHHSWMAHWEKWEDVVPSIRKEIERLFSTRPLLNEVSCSADLGYNISFYSGRKFLFFTFCSPNAGELWKISDAGRAMHDFQNFPYKSDSLQPDRYTA